MGTVQGLKLQCFQKSRYSNFCFKNIKIAEIKLRLVLKMKSFALKASSLMLKSTQLFYLSPYDNTKIVSKTQTVF